MSNCNVKIVRGKVEFLAASLRTQKAHSMVVFLTLLLLELPGAYWNLAVARILPSQVEGEEKDHHRTGKD